MSLKMDTLNFLIVNKIMDSFFLFFFYYLIDGINKNVKLAGEKNIFKSTKYIIFSEILNYR